MKRNYINNSVLCIALLLLVLPLFAADMNNSGAAFIRMGIGGRVLAMGEAGAAITDDIGSVYWNPAGLAHLRDFEVGTTYNFGLDFDRTHTFAAFGTRLPLGTVAFSWVNAAVSDIEGYVDADTPTGTFSDSEHSLAFSYSNYIGRLSFGVTPKIYLSTIDGETEQGYGLDAGLKLDLGRYLQLGAMFRDITSEYAEDKVPWQVSAGLAANPWVASLWPPKSRWSRMKSLIPAWVLNTGLPSAKTLKRIPSSQLPRSARKALGKTLWPIWKPESAWAIAMRGSLPEQAFAFATCNWTMCLG